jgi:hypothetical protein
MLTHEERNVFEKELHKKSTPVVPGAKFDSKLTRSRITIHITSSYHIKFLAFVIYMQIFFIL